MNGGSTRRRRRWLTAAIAAAVLTLCPVANFGTVSEAYGDGKSSSKAGGGGRGGSGKAAAPSAPRARTGGGGGQHRSPAVKAPSRAPSQVRQPSSSKQRANPAVRHNAGKRQQMPAVRQQDSVKRRADQGAVMRQPVAQNRAQHRDPVVRGPKPQAKQQDRGSKVAVQDVIERGTSKQDRPREVERANPKVQPDRRAVNDSAHNRSKDNPKRDPKVKIDNPSKGSADRKRGDIKTGDPIVRRDRPHVNDRKDRSAKPLEPKSLAPRNRSKDSASAARHRDPKVNLDSNVRKDGGLRVIDSFSGDGRSRKDHKAHHRSRSHDSHHGKHGGHKWHGHGKHHHGSACGHSACHGRSFCGFSRRFHSPHVAWHRRCWDDDDWHGWRFSYHSGGHFSIGFSFSNYSSPCSDPWSWRSRYWRYRDCYRPYWSVRYRYCDDDWDRWYCYRRPVFGCYRPRYTLYSAAYYPVYVPTYTYYDEPVVSDYPWLSGGTASGDYVDGLGVDVSFSAQRGWDLLSGDDAREARREFERAIDLYPNDGLPLIGYALAAAQLDRFDEAIAYMRRALAADPRALDEVPQDEPLQLQIGRLLGIYENRAQQSGDMDELFMVAALRYLAGEEALAYFAIDKLYDRGDNEASTLNLRALIQSALDDASAPEPPPAETPVQQAPDAIGSGDISF